MNGEAHQVRATLAHVFPALPVHKTDETHVSGDVDDGGIVRIDGETVNVVDLIDRAEPRRCRNTGTAQENPGESDHERRRQSSRRHFSPRSTIRPPRPKPYSPSTSVA